MRRCSEATRVADDAAAVVCSILAKMGIYDGLTVEGAVAVMKTQCYHCLSVTKTLLDEAPLDLRVSYHNGRTGYCLFDLIQLLSHPLHGKVEENGFDCFRMHCSMHQYIQSLLAPEVSMLAVLISGLVPDLLPSWSPTSTRNIYKCLHHHLHHHHYYCFVEKNRSIEW